MKTIQLFSLLTFLTIFSFGAQAQVKTESIPVSGNCGMCKSKIEKSAKEAGASSATWDTEKKILTVKYNSSSTNAAKIQQKVAAAGYDTRDVKAADAAYDKLHGCCKYERTATGKKEGAACKDGDKHGEKGACCSEGEEHH